MKLKSIASLQYTNAANTTILMTVTLEGEDLRPPIYDGVPIPFHYTPEDPAPVALLVREELAKGTHEIAAYLPAEPPVTLELKTNPPPEPGKSNVIAE